MLVKSKISGTHLVSTKFKEAYDVVTLINWRLGFDITDGVGEPRLNLISMKITGFGTIL